MSAKGYGIDIAVGATKSLATSAINAKSSEITENDTNTFVKGAVGVVAGGVTGVSSLAIEGVGKYAKGGKELPCYFANFGMHILRI